MRVSVIIPTYQAAPYLSRLVRTLREQTLVPAQIIVVDSSSTDGTQSIAVENDCIVKVIPKAEFNHGGTRNTAAGLANGEVLLFMTQDAMPADQYFVEELTLPIREGKVAGSYARQLAYPDAFPPETFARSFNYPSISRTRTLADVPELGIKAYFFSNVSSAVSRELFWSVGGFPDSVILNEDMLLCAKLLRAGHAVAYQGEARVLHSHNYALSQQFKRYFDIGVSTAQAKMLLDGARAGGEGMRFVLSQMRYLIEKDEWRWIPRTVLEVGCKFVAFQLGKAERLLPSDLKRRLSMHAFYWK